MKNPVDLWRTESWSPLRELGALQRSMDRLFEEFTPLSSDKTGFSPAVDVEENDSHYVISFDLPGVKKENVRIDIKDHLLTVSGERADQREEGKPSKRFVERFYGKFTRSFELPSDVDVDNIEADYKDGVLSIALPKSEKAQARQIPIQEGRTGTLLEKWRSRDKGAA